MEQFIKNPLVLSLIQSGVRAALMFTAGAVGLEVKQGEVDTVVGTIAALVLAGISIGWSAWNHKKNIALPPKE